MDKDVLFDISITLGVSRSFKLAACPLAESISNLSPVTACLRHSSLAGNTLTCVALADAKFSQTCLSHYVVHDPHLIRSVANRVASSQTTATVTVGRWRSVAAVLGDECGDCWAARAHKTITTHLCRELTRDRAPKS